MVPKFIMEVETFPQTANGKLDRKALPDPPGLTAAATPVVLTQTAAAADAGGGSGSDSDGKLTMDVHICGVIERVRGVRPGVNASFAAMGVDSLGAIMFVKQLSDSLGGLRILPATVFVPGLTIKQYGVTLYNR